MSILQTYSVQSKGAKKHEAVGTGRTKTKHDSTVEQLAAMKASNRVGIGLERIIGYYLIRW